MIDCVCVCLNHEIIILLNLDPKMLLNNNFDWRDAISKETVDKNIV